MLEQTRGPTILVGTDFTSSSRAAFDSGLRMAREEGGLLVLVHAVRPLGAPGLEMTRPSTARVDNETAEPGPEFGLDGTDWVMLARAQGVEAVVIVRPGLAAAVIADEAERLEARTVFLGNSGKAGLSRVMLGSVAAEVKRNTTRPVVVVPGAPEPIV